MSSGMGWLIGLLMLCVGIALGSFFQRKRMRAKVLPGEKASATACWEGASPKVWTADSIIQFSYDIKGDVVEFSGAFSPVMGNRTRFTRAMELFRGSEILHDKDREAFFHLLDQCQEKSGWVEDTLRFSMGGGQYSWLELRMHRCGNVISGTMVDMAQWKDEVDRWKEKAARDTLTGLYNREYFERTVRAILQEENCDTGAMIFIDVDNFKKINDTQGHRFGDEVLTRVASQIQSVFRHTDIIARYGGDEFLVFAPHIQRPVLKERLTQLCGIFHVDQNYTVSSSIGAALYPQDGQEYESLLDCADCALYAAKAQGKERFLFYEPDMKDVRS